MPKPLLVRRDFSYAACLLSAMSLIIATDLHAGIVLISQDRFVDVTTDRIGIFGSPPIDQRFTAPDFGPFHQSAQLSFPSMAFIQTATQNSTITLTPDGTGLSFDATGSAFSQANFNPLVATTNFQAVFTLSHPEPYFLTYNGEVGNPGPGGERQFVPGEFIGPSAPDLSGNRQTTNYATVLTFSGTLQPGTYALLAEINTMGYGSFDTHLAVGTAVVPLPPALWQTLLWLPPGGLLLRAARRRHRISSSWRAAK